jgi:hypothetical protein
MRLRSTTYTHLGLLLGAVFSLYAPAVSAQTQKPVSPNQFRGYYLQALNRNVAQNATGTLVVLAWNGPSAEADTFCTDKDSTYIAHITPGSPGPPPTPPDTTFATVTIHVCRQFWTGYRIRRTIVGITPDPLGVVGQWKSRDTVLPICLAQQQPCNLSNFVFTGTGVFFRGFYNNKRSDGSYVLDYPPGSPADSDSSARLFVDPATMSGFTTEYTVTSIDTTKTVNADYYESTADTVISIVPATPPAPNMTQVAVVPNPFNVRAQWDPSSSEQLVHFIHLPAGATVRIYTPAGDLVQTLTQNPASSPGGESGELAWNLKNGQGQPVVSGIYIYAVSPPDGRTPARGHFVIIK